MTTDTNSTKLFHFKTPKTQLSHVPRKKTEACRDLTVSIHAMLSISLANTGANLLIAAVLVPSPLVAQHGPPHPLAHLLLHFLLVALPAGRASPRRTPAIRLLVRRALKARSRPLSPKIHTHTYVYTYIGFDLRAVKHFNLINKIGVNWHCEVPYQFISIHFNFNLFQFISIHLLRARS